MQNNNQNRNQNNQNRNQNSQNQKNRLQNNQQQNDLFQFEMGNELGADIEQEKTMFKNEYCKDKLNSNNNQKRQNNNQNRNQQR